MQVSVEAPNRLERRVTVVVPVKTLEDAFDKRVTELAKTAKVNGFRQGKVPLDYIRTRFGDTARQEALSEVIQSSLYAAIHQEKLNPVDVPTVEPKTIAPGQPLEFVATFEVLPEVESVKFELNTLEKKVARIEDADIQNAIKHMRQQQVQWIKVERAAEENDQVIIDFSGSMDGKPFEGGQAHDYPIVIGSKKMIPGFEEGLIGIKADEEKVIPVIFPENYFSKEFAGKAAEFSIKMLKVSEPLLPEINEAFIKRMGVKTGNVDAFHAEIRRNLERECDRVIKAKLKKHVFDHLLEQNPLDIPKALIEREATRIHDELHPHHAGKEHQHTESEMSGFTAAGRQNVALGLLIAHLIKQHTILPDKTRIQDHIQQLSSVYENPAEVVQWYANNKKAKAEVEMLVLEEQLVEKLLENVQITEKMLSYNELIAEMVKQPIN